MNKRIDHIVFFDGVCNLCNQSVDTILKMDKAHIFRFASLQGKTAIELLPPDPQDQFESIIYYKKGVQYSRSQALVQILFTLDGCYKLLGDLINIFPVFLSDFFYNLVAKNRYRLLGKRDTCRIPTEKERHLFLD